MARRVGGLGEVRLFIGASYELALPAKQIDALAGATWGGGNVARGGGDRPRLGPDPRSTGGPASPIQMNERANTLVAKNRKDFDRDGQSTLVLSLVIGRTTPVLWLTVWKEEAIPTRRDDYKDARLRRVTENSCHRGAG